MVWAHGAVEFAVGEDAGEADALGGAETVDIGVGAKGDRGDIRGGVDGGFQGVPIVDGGNVDDDERGSGMDGERRGERGGGARGDGRVSERAQGVGDGDAEEEVLVQDEHGGSESFQIHWGWGVVFAWLVS